MKRTVCIVSSGNLASNPRLVKEAAALQEAGYAVTTISCDYTEALRPFDDEIAAEASWTVRRVPRLRSERYFTTAARRAARALSGAGLPIPLAVAVHAYGGPGGALRGVTRTMSADLYIAHYVPALPAAAEAARRRGALLGFDAEDFHSGEEPDDQADHFQSRLVEQIEAACLPRCAHMTAASPLIGQAYAARYGVKPTTVLNLFPLSMAPSLQDHAAHRHEAGTLKAYWFSQTIGLDRGLQGFVQAMARARTRVTLDIRGSNRWGYGDRLLEMARDLGIGDRVRLLPMAPPEEMVRLAAHYDLGLSLEMPITENRRICLTNKIFTYLLAGTPVMMSDTPAQKALAPELGPAAAVVSVTDVEGMAKVLDGLAATPGALAEAKTAAADLGRRRYNWDVEKKVLVEAVASAFSGAKPLSASSDTRTAG
ncbi:Glycosyltransferase involved in cell wall bisynthesis [Enhydrobacter aerosaccus]|uniref:Glycosyltransferase involved in cell wall bisynthesis n=1 Tax=Enhydrobacter aerosaccus TaxID=225324 RepID=A0A1T4TA47_9HYPH|nr:glycosyltransferase [Enhydrobacter aerosaccus]SKA37201.1 Glycosyltransferase involved in cell wall bisynthesis [Enhydrobacter aerosaccus]